MALFSYEALSREGKRTRGVIDASSLAQAKEQLSRQGLYTTKIEPTTQAATAGWRSLLFGRKVSPKSKILFTKQLTTLLKSGIPLLQALELLVEQFEGRLRSILVSVKDDIKGGTSFADALAKFPRVFDKIYVQLVRAGEASGRLESILARLTNYMERRLVIAKRVRGAFQYPLMQLIVAGLVVGLLFLKIVPMMAENFEAQGAALPGSTRFILALSNFARRYFLLIIGSTVAIIFAFRYWKSTARGARLWDTFKVKLPFVRYFTKTNAVVQFCYTLGMLLEGGVNLSDALDIVVEITDNRILADTLRQARDKIVKQGKIAQYLKDTNIFPPIAIYLIKTGEESGELAPMLLSVADTYESDLGDIIDSLTAKITPIMTIVMALIVGFVVMSVALPIARMGEMAGI